MTHRGGRGQGTGSHRHTKKAPRNSKARTLRQPQHARTRTVETLERKLRRAREQLRTLSRRVLAIQEEERRRIARELHDDLAQFLAAIRLNIEAARQDASPQGDIFLSESLALVDQAVTLVQALALDLRPSILDDLGLVAALRWLLKNKSERGGFDGRMTVRGIDTRLPREMETLLFRLVQEALTNVTRHAAARHVDVDLDAADGTLRVVVRDDGRGFDAPAVAAQATAGTNVGLLSLRERVALAGGRLAITSTAGQGTTIDVRLPLSRQGAR